MKNKINIIFIIRVVIILSLTVKMSLMLSQKSLEGSVLTARNALLRLTFDTDVKQAESLARDIAVAINVVAEIDKSIIKSIGTEGVLSTKEGMYAGVKDVIAKIKSNENVIVGSLFEYVYTDVKDAMISREQSKFERARGTLVDACNEVIPDLSSCFKDLKAIADKSFKLSEEERKKFIKGAERHKKHMLKYSQYSLEQRKAHNATVPCKGGKFCKDVATCPFLHSAKPSDGQIS